jgi:cytochrome c biogenesis protein CcmG/thiol:disulfide interchange protein DsbE
MARDDGAVTGRAPDTGGRVRFRARRLAGVGLVALLIAAGAWAATRPLGSGDAVAGPASGGPSEIGIDVGDAAPEFPASSEQAAFVDLDGDPVRLADFAGHPVWIVFWATWCTPCQEEAADIVAAFHAHQGDGLQVLAIDVQEPAASVRQFVTARGLDYRVALDSTAAVQEAYGGWGLPVHFFLDAAGTIRDRYFGQLTRDGMEQRLRSILGS